MKEAVLKRFAEIAGKGGQNLSHSYLLAIALLAHQFVNSISS
ncbi:hypothetical protein [Sphaerothrix gracilis]